MRKRIARLGLATVVLLSLCVVAFAQNPRPLKKRYPKPEEPVPEATPPLAPPEETLRTDTNLVTVPVIVSDANGTYVPDLTQDDFSVSEDGAKQNIAFFTTVSAPFHVVLMLDTSASTQEKLGQIQRAATAFVEQLQPADRVKVISFDDTLRELNEFTNDRAELSRSIMRTRPGQGTRLYDAFELALNSVRAIQGRKAIVLFTDGVDWHSDQATFDGSLHYLDEEGVIVYPIRFETRADTERLVRQQSEAAGPQLPTIGVIRTPPTGTTAPTFPSDDPETVPTRGARPSQGIPGMPSPTDILRGRRRNDPYPPDDRRPPDGSRDPTTDPRNEPRGPIPRNGEPRNGDPRGIPGDGSGGTSRSTRRSTDDSTDTMLDGLYLTADSYLKALAEKTGGRLLRADTLGSLPEAFANIAAELRTQYSIGYYPTNAAHDGQYRKIKVNTTRKNTTVRARPGYRAPSGG